MLPVAKLTFLKTKQNKKQARRESYESVWFCSLQRVAAVPTNSVNLRAATPRLTCCHWRKALGPALLSDPAAVHPPWQRGRIPGMQRKPPAAPGAGQVTGGSGSGAELPPSTKAALLSESCGGRRRQKALCSRKSTLSLLRLGGGGEATQEAGLVGRPGWSR